MGTVPTRLGLGLLLILGFLAAPVAAHGQGTDQDPGERTPDRPGLATRTFGTPLVSHTLQAFAFAAFDAAANNVVAANGMGSRFCTASCTFEAALHLPAGALVQAIELAACDTNPAASVTASLIRIPAPEGSAAVLASRTTGAPNIPGCTFFQQFLATAHTVDNHNNTYIIQVAITGNASTTRFQAVRIFYTLQVSPAPAVATFNDVPTGHAFFRFIEALVAAGITTGCDTSPPLYCPDNPVTRGQMAAFISRALGLQFAP